ISNLSPTLPNPRFSTQMTYDARDGYVLLFGGYGCFSPGCTGGIFGQGPLNDTWSFSGGNWSPITTPVAPPTTENGGLTYDSTDQEVVLLTECSCSVSSPVTETWTYAAGVWTNVTANQSVQPSFGSGGVSIADSPWDKGVILFGGQGFNSTWLFSNGSWSNITGTVGPGPASRYDAGFALDSTEGSPVLFGGFLQPVCSTCLPTVNDTWVFHHGRWVNASGGWAPTPRGTGQVADDPADRGALLWGESGGLNAADTWWYGPPPNLTVDPRASPPVVDASLPVQLFAGESGGVPPYLLNWTQGNRTLGSTPTLTEQFGAPGHYVVGINASDRNNHSANATTSVDLVANLTETANASSTQDAAGVAIQFAGSHNGGVAPFLTIWRFGDGAWSNRSNCSHVFQTSGSYTVWFWTNDSAGASVGTPIALTVTAAISTAVTESANVTDVGVAVVFNATAMGGVPPIQSSWNFGDGATAIGPSASHIFLAPGHYVVQSWANDSVGGSVTASIALTVNARPVVSLVSSGPLDLGQTLGLQASSVNGSGTIGYSWQGLPTGCGTSPLARIYCAPSTAGGFVVVVTGTDAVGVSVASPAVAVTVFPILNATLHLAPTSIDLGQAASLSVNVSGGAPQDAITFSGLPSGCPSENATSIRCVAGAQGTFHIRAHVTDSVGGSANGSASLVVNPGLAVSGFWVNTSFINLGDNVTFTFAAIGGSGARSYSYTALPPGCASSNTSLLSCRPSAAGNFTVDALVADAAGEHAGANVSLLVLPAPGGGTTATGLSGAIPYELLGAVGAAILAVLLVWRRYRRPPTGTTGARTEAEQDREVGHDPGVAEAHLDSEPTERGSPLDHPNRGRSRRPATG
ncbi:MAG: PKD domain-containing protein, partial [Thermoplasmata archaeon]|nr:PKD domain-containing protein [Thermoplasmata archaeon]